MTRYNEDLQKLVEALEGGGASMMPPGWLMPDFAWAVFRRYGILRSLLAKVAGQLAASSWDYVRSDVEYDWSGVYSDLETLRLPEVMRQSALFAQVFGGVVVYPELDLGAGPHVDTTLPLDLSEVRAVKRFRVLTPRVCVPCRADGTPSAITSASHVRWTTPNARGGMTTIHRSRVAVVLDGDLPDDGSELCSTTTGFPPSTLESLLSDLEDWKKVERSNTRLANTISLLAMQMKDWNRNITSPDPKVRADAKAVADEIAKRIHVDGVLFFDDEDALHEVGRRAAGVNEIALSKREAFVASTGYNTEWVLGIHSGGGLSNGDGPARQIRMMLGATRRTMFPELIELATDLVLAARYHGPTFKTRADFPREYTIAFKPVDERTTGDIAKERTDSSAARERDAKAGVPPEIIWSDPDIVETYPAAAEWLAERNEAARAAKARGSDPTAIVPGERWVPVSVLAEELGVGRATLIAMIRAGRLPGRQIGSRWKVPYERALASFGTESAVAEQVPEQADARSDALPLGLELTTETSFGNVYGASEVMREVFTVLGRVVRTDIPVLLLGETGTGKDGFARGVHEQSGRVGRYVAVNCGALGDEVGDIARALLGLADAPGVFELADGGTLFLDEVGELPLEGQAVLLRALAGEVAPVGSRQVRKVDVRIVAATHCDLSDSRRFRPDLFERIAGLVVEVPPLRERGTDILDLAEMFRVAAARSQGVSPAPMFSADARAVMLAHGWPGNVRQLRSAVARGVALAWPGAIDPTHLQLHEGRSR